jgi:hypothetical protein
MLTYNGNSAKEGREQDLRYYAACIQQLNVIIELTKNPTKVKEILGVE